MHNEPQRANDDWDDPRSSSGDAVSAADEAVRRWSAIDAALSPIIGMRGVAALYRRSVTVARSKHPALNSVHVSERGTAPFQSLHDALVQSSSNDAASANAALVATFTGLLGQLIGVKLTAQLLGQSDGIKPGTSKLNDDRP